MKSISTRIFALISLLISSAPVFAEEVAEPECQIRIRALTAQAGNAKPAEIVAPAAMADMKKQLERLPFTHYDEITTVEGTTALRESKLFTFEDMAHATHRVTIIPHGLVAGAGSKPKLSFSINWRGPGNAEYLHTKLGFENGKSMLVGADQSSGSPLVLCVTVRCLPVSCGGAECASARHVDDSVAK